MVEGLENCKKIVEMILEEDIESRNHDVRLICEVWKHEGVKHKLIDDELYFNAADMYRTFTPETITRVRREIQNDEGRFLPTRVEILIKRKIREDHIRNYYSNSLSYPELWSKYTLLRFNVK